MAQTVTESPVEIMVITTDHLVRANRLIPGGAYTASKSPSRYVNGPSPLFVSRGKGCYIWDIEDRKYLDFGMALGASILGYANREVDLAVWAAMKEGTLFTLPSYREAQTAETFLSYIPWAEQVRFGKTGTDVTTAAVRVARAVTGRHLVLSHGYHGWADWAVSLTPPAVGVEHNQSVERIEWLEDVGNFNKVAAVVVEVAPGGNLDDQGWYKQLRQECDGAGTILIFDEVLSGFRYRMGSATDVIPDLACFGKSIGNGYAVSALVGKKELMSQMEPGGVFFSGTAFGETTGLAACEATLKIMDRERVPERITWGGRDLRDRLNAMVADVWTGDGARTTVHLSQEQRDFIQQECVKRGMLFLGAHNICMAHRAAEINKVVEVYAEVWELMNETEDLVQALDGEPSNVPFRMQ